MATTAITRTFDSGGDTLKWTYSMWLKRASIESSAYQYLFIGRLDGTNVQEVYFHTDDTLAWYNYKGGYEGQLKTERVFRDCSAWYHIQLVWDSANVTSGDRMIIYVNGVRETEFSTESYPDASETSIINTANPHAIGWHVGDTDKAFDGCMSWVQFVNAAALAATEFGEVESTSGIWKIKTGAYATPGTNGFTLSMEDRSNLDLDTSSNAYTFSTTGTLTPTYDNPSNNFSTINYLDNYYAGSSFANGNCTLTTGSSQEPMNTGTFGLSAGKWYCESKLTQLPTSSNSFIGITAEVATSSTDFPGNGEFSWSILGQTGNLYNDGSSSAYGGAIGLNDVVGWYLDLDNNKWYYAIDGVIQASGVGASITAAASTPVGTAGGTPTGVYFPAWGDYNNSSSAIWQVNFGNGYFGTTEITSPETDEGGIGAFKYNPSTGTFDSSSKDFRAICTKNIKLYGRA